MKNKGYTIMEAVIAMFLVLVMVGAVFSALMSSRRAIITSSEREELFYSLNSVYGMLKDCRTNPDSCHLKNLNGSNCFSGMPGNQDLISCDGLFTFNFQNLCKATSSEDRTFKYDIQVSSYTPQAWLSYLAGACPASSITLQNFYLLDLQANCTEAL